VVVFTTVAETSSGRSVAVPLAAGPSLAVFSAAVATVWRSASAQAAVPPRQLTLAIVSLWSSANFLV
jgi:hypothetical protein